MAAILRVKRKKDDEPLDALLLSCKRQKVESNTTDTTPLTSIVKFAGTVEKQDDCVIEHITKRLNKDTLKESYKQHIVDIAKKVRDKTKQESNENRYKIINNIRSLDTSMNEYLEEEVVNIIDIEDTQAIPDDKNDSGYVYDLYYTKMKDNLQLDNIVSILPVEEDLVFEDYYKEEEEECNAESEDSNSESNWRNDYPDSEHSENSIGENDIRNAIRNLNIDNDLSSEDEDYAYGLKEDDVERYGYRYAKYKARMLKESECNNSRTDESDELEEFCDQESDELEH